MSLIGFILSHLFIEETGKINVKKNENESHISIKTVIEMLKNQSYNAAC